MMAVPGNLFHNVRYCADLAGSTTKSVEPTAEETPPKQPAPPQKRKKAAAKAAAEEPAGKKAKPDESKDAGADGGEGNDDDLAGIFSEDEPDKDEDVDPLANVLET